MCMDIVFHKQFTKKFKKLSPKIQNQFYERLELFLTYPTHPTLNNHRVGRVFSGCRSINITGDYRAVFHQDKSTATFITIGTHSELY